MEQPRCYYVQSAKVEKVMLCEASRIAQLLPLISILMEDRVLTKTSCISDLKQDFYFCNKLSIVRLLFFIE